ncbi:MAG: type II secretion system F family protein [Candidatus Baldrarchaeia archaeon]
MPLARLFTKSEKEKIWVLSLVISIAVFTGICMHSAAPQNVLSALQESGMSIQYLLRSPDSSIAQKFLKGLQDMTLALLVSLLAMLTPLAIMYTMEDRWIDGVDEKIAALLRDLSDSMSAGISISQALIMTSKGQGFGILNEPLRKLAVRVSWGVPFTEAIRDFANSLGTPLSKRLEGIIIEAYRCGGNVEEIFSTAAEHISKLWELKRTRRGEVRPFMFTIYIAFFVFLIITLIFAKILFPILSQMSSLAAMGAGGGTAGATLTAISEAEVKFANIILFHAVILEGLVGGLVIGKTIRGRITSGFLHALIMLIIGVVFYILMFVAQLQFVW